MKFSLIRLLILFCAGAAVLGSCSYLPGTTDLSGTVVTDYPGYILVEPSNNSADIGIMFWPGGLVDPHSYQYSLAPAAASGYRVMILKVPANLAILSIEKGVRAAEREGGRWIAAGHSLGGVCAAWSVYNNPALFEGLVLMASYPAESKSLAAFSIPVLSLYAENDGLAPPSEIVSKSGLLPDTTVYHQIAGGNHSQFGSYGFQEGDGTASITPEEQYQEMALQIDAFIQGLQ